MKYLKRFNENISDEVEIEKDHTRHSEHSEKDDEDLLQKVKDGLEMDIERNPGYRSFKEELLGFLNEFPKE